MNKWLLNSIGVALLAVLGIVGWAAWRIGIVAKSIKIPDFVQIAYKLDLALDTVNRPCAPGPCGTLAEANKGIVKVGDAIVTTQLQERAIAPHTIAAVDALNGAAGKLGDAAGNLSGTAQAATGTLQQARTDLEAANGSIQAFQPLLGHADATVQDFDTLLKDPTIPETLTNAEQITWNANEITFDAKRVADDATKKYFTPLPWWRKAIPYATAGAKIAAYALPW